MRSAVITEGVHMLPDPNKDPAICSFGYWVSMHHEHLAPCPWFVREALQKYSNHRETMQPIEPVSVRSFNDLGTLQDQLIFSYKEEVGGSNPSTPTEKRAVARLSLPSTFGRQGPGRG